MRKLALLPILLLAAFPAAAQYVYLIPISGSGTGADNFYDSSLSAINRGSQPATVRVGETYTVPGSNPCYVSQTPPTQTIPAGGVVNLTGAFCDIGAFTIESTQPLAVSELLYINFKFGASLSCIQLFANHIEERIEALSDLLPANVESPMWPVRIGGTSRAHLAVVNPNSVALNVHVRIVRPEFQDATVERAYVVAAKSLLYVALDEVQGTPPPHDDPIVVSNQHVVYVRADAPFAAGVSSVSPFFEYASWRPAVPPAP